MEIVMLKKAYNPDFMHKVDKSLIPVCNIMGVNIAAIDMEWLLKFTKENIYHLSGDYMCVSNVHTTMMSWDNKEYCLIQNGGIMAIPDGKPLSYIGRRRGYIKMQRTAGPDYMNEIFRISAQENYKHYFYGATDETLKKIKENLEKNYPGIQIAGMYSPPFRPMTVEEDNEIIKTINNINPDFLWIGLGAPKQEIWMAEHQGKINGYMVGVGAGFDYLAGNVTRAPEWMQKHGLEWLHRLWQEPGRLWKRYLKTNTRFVWYTILRGK